MKIRQSLLVAGSFLFVAACGGSQPEAESPGSAPSSEPPAEAAQPSASADSPPADSAAPAAAAPSEAASAEPAASPKTASFDIMPKSGSKLTGNVTLTDTGSGVDVVITVAGIKPGKHGAHVHENPDCSSMDGKSAGSHYNPDKHPHGLPTAVQHHLGDLGNIDVGPDGKGKLEVTMPGANLKEGDPHSFLGRSIIIHEKADNGGQPVGNAGGRIGCAVLK